MNHKLTTAVFCLAALLVGACGDDEETFIIAPEDLKLTTASQRPDMVSGDDALVAFEMPSGADESQVVVRRNGEEISPSLRPLRDGRLGALVDGLSEGENQIEVKVGDITDTLTVVNYPIVGPIFSGPHLPLPVCTTEANGLGPALDENCSAATLVQWRYLDQEGEFQPLDDPSEVPDDVEILEESGLPFIVREELGTINRAIYWITVFDPAPGQESWDSSQWNGRLVYQFGGGCGTTYSQGFRLQGAPSAVALAAGYAFASATFNTLQVMCNDVLSAETVLMVKEHFTERYGVPELTIGEGGSGGAIQQYMIGQNYPGLLDALSPTVPFADVTTTSAGVLDCSLLINFYGGAGASWSDAQRTAVNGHLTSGTCDLWEISFAPGVRATEGCEVGLAGALPGVPDLPSLDPALIYDPVDNPDGLRCTVQDTNINVGGIDPETGFARRPWDNVGVQYGLAAMNDGAISVDQFLDLNGQIGGFDADGLYQDARSAVSEETVRGAYETGRVVTGDSNLRYIPIISTDIWTDDQGDIHDRIRPFAVRERLRLDDGTDAPGHMIWTRDPEGASLIDNFVGGGNQLGALSVLDTWLTAMLAEPQDDPLVLLESTRPEAAIDNCITPDDEFFSGLDLYDNPGPCTDPYPISSGPRIVAGAPSSEHIVKCTLQSVASAVEAGIYAAELSAEQRARLESIFPEGVCNYSVPGVGEAPLRGTWLRY
jgi:hypothetical protein